MLLNSLVPAQIARSQLREDFMGFRFRLGPSLSLATGALAFLICYQWLEQQVKNQVALRSLLFYKAFFRFRNHEERADHQYRPEATYSRGDVGEDSKVV